LPQLSYGKLAYVRPTAQYRLLLALMHVIDKTADDKLSSLLLSLGIS